MPAERDELVRRVRRDLSALRGFVRRSGLTGWVQDRRADFAYRRAFESVAALEDAAGVDAAGRFADRLTALRQEATAAGLLDVADVGRLEREALAELDRRKARYGG